MEGWAGTLAQVQRGIILSVASGIPAGLLVSVFMQPCQVVRTRMQVDAARGLSQGVLQTLQAIVAEGGVTHLWKGARPTFLYLSLALGLRLVCLEAITPLLEASSPEKRKREMLLGVATAAGLAHGLAATVATPLSVLKTHLEHTGPKALQGAGIVDAARHILRQQGLRGFCAGAGPVLLSSALYTTIYYTAYMQMQEHLQGLGWPQYSKNVTAGVVSTLAATLITQPADVIRTHMQLGLAPASAAAGLAPGPAFASAIGAGAGAGAASLSASQAARHILKSQGAVGLLRGTAPLLVKRIFETAIIFAVYDGLARVLSH